MEERLVGEVEEPVQNYGLMTVLILCLGKPGGGRDNGILKLLNVLLSSETGAAEKRKILQTDFDIPMTQVLEGRPTDMCNSSGGVESRGIAKGIERGCVEDRAEGAMEAAFSALKNLMEVLNFPVEQAMETLKISESDCQHYGEFLAKLKYQH